MTICAKCNIDKDVHSKHFGQDGVILCFCSECAWRLMKMGYPDIKSYLNAPRDIWSNCQNVTAEAVVRENRVANTIDDPESEGYDKGGYGDWNLNLL